MPAAHIAGVPVEETVLSLGGPAAIYLALIATLSAARRAGGRLRTFARRGPGVSR